jgi:hypothetical protein
LIASSWVEPVEAEGSPVAISTGEALSNERRRVERCEFCLLNYSVDTDRKVQVKERKIAAVYLLFEKKTRCASRIDRAFFKSLSVLLFIAAHLPSFSEDKAQVK